jgi:hypothetical protein
MPSVADVLSPGTWVFDRLKDFLKLFQAVIGLSGTAPRLRPMTSSNILGSRRSGSRPDISRSLPVRLPQVVTTELRMHAVDFTRCLLETQSCGDTRFWNEARQEASEGFRPGGRRLEQRRIWISLHGHRPFLRGLLGC